MLRRAAIVVLALSGLGHPAAAGVLSATDMQRLRDYRQFVVPAAREMPPLRDLAGRVDTLILAARQAGESGDGFRSVDVLATLRDFSAIGGAALQRMISRLEAVHDPRAFAPPEWVAMLTEVKAEIDERLAYDAKVLKVYQRRLTLRASALGQSLPRWQERPNAPAHWQRFEKALDRAQGF